MSWHTGQRDRNSTISFDDEATSRRPRSLAVQTASFGGRSASPFGFIPLSSSIADYGIGGWPLSERSATARSCPSTGFIGSSIEANLPSTIRR